MQMKKTPHIHFHSIKNNWQKNKRIKTRHSSKAPAFFEAWNLFSAISRTISLLSGDVCRQAVRFKQCTSETSGSGFTVRELIGKYVKDGDQKVKKNQFLSRTKTLRLQYCDPLHHIALVVKFLWRALRGCNVKSFASVCTAAPCDVLWTTRTHNNKFSFHFMSI